MTVEPGRTNHAQAHSTVGVGYQPLPAPRILRAAEQQGDVPPPVRSMTALRLGVELRAARHRVRDLECEVAALKVELARRPTAAPVQPAWVERSMRAMAYGHQSLGGGWTLEPERLRLVGPGAPVRLTTTECLLLASLAATDDVVPWPALVDLLVGSGQVLADAMHTVRVQLTRLRGKLRRAGVPVAIGNVPALGYVLVREDAP